MTAVWNGETTGEFAVSDSIYTSIIPTVEVALAQLQVRPARPVRVVPL
jgi:hypothetical protein